MSEPDDLDLSAVRDLAVSLARGGGELARRAKGEGWDQDPPIDRDVERRIVHTVAARFPKHAVVSTLRRTGPDDAEVVWIVDPLDGSINYGIGLEVFGVSIAVQVAGRTELGVVHDSVSGRTCSAVRGQGAWREGIRLAVRDQGPVAEGVVAWLGWSDERAAVLDRAGLLVLRTGAPTADWALLASGGIDAVVGSAPTWSTAAGLLLAIEAGATVQERNDLLIVGTSAAAAALDRLL